MCNRKSLKRDPLCCCFTFPRGILQLRTPFSRAEGVRLQELPLSCKYLGENLVWQRPLSPFSATLTESISSFVFFFFHLAILNFLIRRKRCKSGLYPSATQDERKKIVQLWPEPRPPRKRTLLATPAGAPLSPPPLPRAIPGIKIK